ncbi:MAG: TatD family hydrolase [Leptothrix ochracea]|uniref:TatD family hydrolase n=1 Tax=Leptothrix ochracea TaxID=735331 RepID=UPI0034E24766
MPTPDPPLRLIDTHCHLDAPEFDVDRTQVRLRAADACVSRLVLPAVDVFSFKRVQAWAHAHHDAYALGVHPLYVEAAPRNVMAQVAAALAQARDDPHLVAVGEIGLDFFVPGLDAASQARQEVLCAAQLAMAAEVGLPVILHSRRAVDRLLALLRRSKVRSGIAHAFNGSDQQAHAFLDLGFKLGFGGAMTFERALQLRRLAGSLPADAFVLETDAPDMAPQWRYCTAAERAAGAVMRNEPGELLRIATVLAELRGSTVVEIAHITHANALHALPKLGGLT